jgi:hypothetical protein
MNKIKVNSQDKPSSIKKGDLLKSNLGERYYIATEDAQGSSVKAFMLVDDTVGDSYEMRCPCLKNVSKVAQGTQITITQS